MKVLDLFSGIGGFSLGLERAGMETIAFCEIDPYCQKVLGKHWPDVPIHEDIKDLDGHTYENKIDLICGGFPCQDISHGNAGEPAGITGKRSGLWGEMARIVCEIRPRFVIVENVSALLVRGASEILGDLARLGYDAEWFCIPACATGAPHLRARIWILAYPRCERSGASENPILSGWEAAWLCDWWSTEPSVDRVADGIPYRVDRHRALGNAVVPQVVEVIGRAIMKCGS